MDSDSTWPGVTHSNQLWGFYYIYTICIVRFIYLSSASISYFLALFHIALPSFSRFIEKKIFFFWLFRAALAAYGSSQARGRIRAVAAGLHHSHRKRKIQAVSATYAIATSQQHRILNPLSKARDRTCILMDTRSDSFPLSHYGKSIASHDIVQLWHFCQSDDCQKFPNHGFYFEFVRLMKLSIFCGVHFAFMIFALLNISLYLLSSFLFWSSQGHTRGIWRFPG